MGKSVKEGIMPRETIRGLDYEFVPVEVDLHDTTPQPWPAECKLPVLEVGWSKAPTGHVEVATGDIALLFGPDGLIHQIAEARIHDEDIEVVVRDFFLNGSGFWVTLDRDGCNEAIRRLRAARDQAFGKDA